MAIVQVTYLSKELKKILGAKFLGKFFARKNSLESALFCSEKLTSSDIDDIKIPSYFLH